ncbi:phenylalanine--tRNA ligase subunit beta [Bailinhaonella thermotolerans]|uniref:Phenylalanine--tRNA ligase beta subunit n=1 Tax=Bailinhaonella thermotolerans TaxID=1070861 RepID=A0A3A4B8D9_9ACTN|nr:phenylalanine--tRNA ligase subunit beta [Bailinhaonella thermotolerans]RJL33954.1 phenylalanine--tRNA ligase subunit beta [Bailinhaonella thermotolerans]
MKVPLSWLREYAELPPVTAQEVADRLTAAGLKLEAVESVGHDVKNVVVGRVLDFETLEGFKKPIRWCTVEVGEAEPRGIICGATNFAAGDVVPVALPGAVLPGGFEVGSRKTYGKISDGMICSARELGVGDDHDGILILPRDTPIGADVVELLGLRDDVLDLEVTTDRGYALSIRGVAREAALAYGVPFRDPADVPLPAAEGPGYPASIGDPTACDRFALRMVEGFDPAAPTPMWMRVRLARVGIRSVSLAVDVTNYVMHEMGQPLHAFDRATLTGEIVVRRARPGEKLETLDHVERALHPEDVLITDDSGPIGLAGTMGGLRTEVSGTTTDLVIEAAHFTPSGVARMSRRHQLVSDASRKFERGVDTEIQLQASARAVALLAELGGGRIHPGLTFVTVETAPTVIAMRTGHPDRVAGLTYGPEVVVRRLREVGCVVEPGEGAEGEWLKVTAPSWRPDLTDPNDLAEEVIRLEGYDRIESVLPAAPAGAGLTEAQRYRRRVGRALASAGFTEVLAYPFVSPRDWDDLQLPEGDARRRAVRLANPLSEDEPLMRTTLLPGLLKILVRNTGRGFTDVALFETGAVYRPRPDAPATAPVLRVDRGPTPEEVASIEAALPDQPLRVAAVLAGDAERPGWWGQGRRAGWADAIEAARLVAFEAGVTPEVRADEHAPWHPGRCAALYAGDVLLGHAGELHPRVVEAYGLPPRTCALELELTRLEALLAGPAQTPAVSPYPIATQDVALIVPAGTPVAEVEAALREGAGDLLEDIRLFDVYTGAQVGEGNKSLAYTLRFRAPDRTLTAEEASASRDAAVAEATRRVGAHLRT